MPKNQRLYRSFSITELETGFTGECTELKHVNSTNRGALDRELGVVVSLSLCATLLWKSGSCRFAKARETSHYLALIEIAA